MFCKRILNFLASFSILISTIFLIVNPAFSQTPVSYIDEDGYTVINIDSSELPGTADQTGVGYNGSNLDNTGVRSNVPQGPDGDIFSDLKPESHGTPFTAEDLRAQERANRAEGERERFKDRMNDNMSGKRSGRKAGAPSTPSAEDIDEMLKKLDDPNISELNKKRLAGVIFYHSDAYRKAVALDNSKYPPDSSRVKKFLEYKKAMQVEVISRMGLKYKAKYGEAPKTPIIPFNYNNINSDDDIVTGTGEVGRRLESIYNEALSEVVGERVGRPMTSADRARIDVNGLAWNMTQKAAHLDFSHHEKYINPQSGYANQAKLIEDAKKGSVTAYTFDNDGRMIKLDPQETVEEIKRLAVDAPLDIPGINPKVGSGSMADFIRMAELHKISPKHKVTVEEVLQFLRNQKYSQRVIINYKEIFKDDAKMLQKFKDFIDTTNKLRSTTSIEDAARILEASTGIKTFSSVGEVDYEKLTQALLTHQNKQLNLVLPEMMGEVTRTEAYKIIEWLKTAGKGNRVLLRKKMASTYAPFSDEAVEKIASQIDKMSIDEADKTFIRSVIEDDSRQIRGYAELIGMDPGEFSRQIKIEGDNIAFVQDLSENARFKPLNDAISARPGGSKFKKFLETKTAKALNLDVMLSPEASKSSKFMQWSMILMAAQRAYGATDRNDEALKQMGMAVFEMVPFVASALRFSDMDYRESAKEFMMDILPPLALANLGVQAFNYTANTAINEFTETIWDNLAVEVLRDMSDEDFEQTEIKSYWRLKNRKELLEYLDEVSPSLGRIAKLAPRVVEDIDARMARNKDVQNNEAALVTILWLKV